MVDLRPPRHIPTLPTPGVVAPVVAALAKWQGREVPSEFDLL
jgi:hypothetical protein